MLGRWSLILMIALAAAAVGLVTACSPDQTNENGGGDSEDDEGDYDPDAPQPGGDDDDSGDDDDDDDDTDDDADDDSDDDADDDDEPYQPPDGMQVVFYDIGQGDAALIRFPGGTTMLIDGGPNQAGDHVIVPAFDDLNLEYLDIMVTTHPDADHCGGLDDVLEAVEVGALWENGDSKDTVTWTEFSDLVDDLDIPRRIKHRGDSEVIDGCDVDVLNADQGWGDANDKSIVLMIECENIRVLMTADATEDVDEDLIDVYGSDLEADVAKVPHHGSPDRDSDLPGYVKPEYAMISVGADNDYGHPNAQVIAEWEAAGAEVYRTDEDGTITLDAKDGVMTIGVEF